MKKKNKPKKPDTWSFGEILEAFNQCSHIHFGDPCNNFVEWKDLKKSLGCIKSGKPYSPLRTVKDLYMKEPE